MSAIRYDLERQEQIARIGHSNAELFAKEGTKIVLSGHREELGNSIVEKIKKRIKRR